MRFIDICLLGLFGVWFIILFLEIAKDVAPKLTGQQAKKLRDTYKRYKKNIEDLHSGSFVYLTMQQIQDFYQINPKKWKIGSDSDGLILGWEDTKFCRVSYHSLMKNGRQKTIYVLLQDVAEAPKLYDFYQERITEKQREKDEQKMRECNSLTIDMLEQIQVDIALYKAKADREMKTAQSEMERILDTIR